MIERLSLVLAGVDPDAIEVLAGNQSKRTPDILRRSSIAQLSLNPEIKQVSPSKMLLNEHRRILAPYYAVDAEKFAQLWHDSKLVAGGQESTELIKAVHWLKKTTLDEKGGLTNDGDLEKAIATPKLAPKMLFYLFHTATRRIQRESHKTPPSTKPLSLPQRVLCRLGLRETIDESPIYIPDEILHESENYLVNAIKLGKVLQFVSQNERRQRA